MSTIQRAKKKTNRFRWTPEQFQKAAEDGWFGERKVELLDGDVYAHNKIPIYWIVSIERRTVEVFSGPVGQGDLATYAGTPLTYHEGESVPVELDGSVVGHLDVTEIFS